MDCLCAFQCLIKVICLKSCICLCCQGVFVCVYIHVCYTQFFIVYLCLCFFGVSVFIYVCLCLSLSLSVCVCVCICVCACACCYVCANCAVRPTGQLHGPACSGQLGTRGHASAAPVPPRALSWAPLHRARARASGTLPRWKRVAWPGRSVL